MKKYLFTILTLLVLILTACGASTTTDQAATDPNAAVAEIVSATMAAAPKHAPGTEASSNSASLNTDYPNATPIQLQIAIGIFKLDGTDLALTAAQANSLLPLWTAMQTTTDQQISDPNNAAGEPPDTTAAQEEMATLIEQSLAALTPEQVQAIANMQISQEVVMETLRSRGLTVGGPNGNGNGVPQGGDMQPPQNGQGQPPQGEAPDGGQPPSDGQAMGTPPANGIPGPGINNVPPGLIEALVQYLQETAAS